MSKKPLKVGLQSFFDRVVLINLKRRPDRLAQALSALSRCKWPFKQPEIFEAIDGHAVPQPAKWQSGPGAWGCMRSHQLVLEKAIKDGVKNILIMEDDVCFADDFTEKVKRFFDALPKDWDGLMLGGQHRKANSKPKLLKRGVLRCKDCERMHCYAVRGEFMRKLHERLLGGGKYDGNVHCDWIMGRDPDLQPNNKVYAPEIFLAGQERGYSDINRVNRGVLPRKFWNLPSRNLSVINLHTRPPVAIALQEYGFYFGSNVVCSGYPEKKLAEIFRDDNASFDDLKVKLREWIKTVQWELASDPSHICTVWHPLAAPKLIKAASLWPVCEINADRVENALKQLPVRLRKILLIGHKYVTSLKKSLK